MEPSTRVKLLFQIDNALESLEMVYNCHPELVGHNDIMWRAVRKIADAHKELLAMEGLNWDKVEHGPGKNQRTI